LYRYIAKPDFLSVPLNQFLPRPFLATALVFGLAHNEWLAGIVCGAVYQWLVLRKGRLGDALTAHAITNFLLGAWIVWRGAWQFW
jgi:CAAX prenyl protease-like protein